MSWITLTEAHLENHLSGDELDALKTESLADGQDSPVDDILTEVTRKVRGYVGANPANTLGEAGTIPDELKDSALQIVKWELINRLPGMSFLADERREDQKDDAIRLLERVADGKFAIAQPETASDEVVNSAHVAVVTSRTKKATSTELNGL